jgi:hypothetical protein
MDWELYDDKGVLAAAYDPMYYLYTGQRGIPLGFHKPQTTFIYLLSRRSRC